MTTGEMAGFTKRFKEIMAIKSSYQRDIRLANLMTDLEGAYNIPMFKNEEFEKKNQFVMELYRTVSIARTFDDEVSPNEAII